MQSSATIRDVEIPVLEDVTDEEVEGMLASESKKATPKQSKLKVPRKEVDIVNFVFFYLLVFYFLALF